MEKGTEGGKCNRTACQQTPATEYNHSTRKWYCVSCACDIQRYENTQSEPFCIFTKFYVGKENDK